MNTSTKQSSNLAECGNKSKPLLCDVTSGIKWDIDHDYSYNGYLLSGDYKGQRFVKPVLDKFWGIPLMYAKWCIERRYLILYGNIT
jgi:hypothetical protein